MMPKYTPINQHVVIAFQAYLMDEENRSALIFCLLLFQELDTQIKVNTVNPH